MQDKTDSVKSEPRKLEKPAREEQEMKREDLVTYADEAAVGGGVHGNALPMDPEP